MPISVDLQSQTNVNPTSLFVSTPFRMLVRSKYSSGDLVSHCFDNAVDYHFLPNSLIGSAQNIGVLTSASGLQGNHVPAEVSSHV